MKTILKWSERNILLGLFFSIIFYFLILQFVVAVNGEEFEKLPTDCILVGEYYECEARGDFSGNAVFFISVGDVEECPNECCTDETVYSVLLCEPGYECIDNECIALDVEDEETVIEEDSEKVVPSPGIDIGSFILYGGIIAIAALVLVYFILKRKQVKEKPKKNFDELYLKYGRRRRKR